MLATYYKSDTRGKADHGWLSSKHTFSFAGYYNPMRMNFGKLRVFNDDIIQPEMGFGMHFHDNMEIISIPIYGELIHRDSNGNIQIIAKNEVQLMSAGKGIYHSEYNNSSQFAANFLQIWIEPFIHDTEPGYWKMTFPHDTRENVLQKIAGPEKSDLYLHMKQNAHLFLGNFNKGFSADYKLQNPDNGIYIFVISGEIQTEQHTLSLRDGMGINGTDKIEIRFNENSEILLMELPM